MRRTRTAHLVAATAVTSLLAGLALTGSPAVADPPDGNPRGHGPAAGHGGGPSDVRSVGPDYNHGKKVKIDRARSAAARNKAKKDTPVRGVKVGDSKTWLALDDAKNSIYLKTYTLRGIGDHIEVWVADDRAFPTGDCRNSLGLTDITDAQVDSFVDEFDHNIYPTESQAFSVPPDRDGTGAATDALGVPKHYYKTNKKGADNTVVLVDNVKDANYYAPDTPDGQTYIAGFHYSLFNEYVDRNVMTIDAFDWLHRTGANPPDDSADPGYLDCDYATGEPRPRLYEGTFAHEYQHLLEYYQDGDEVSWVNEGLSDYAQTLVGYVDPSIPVTDETADSHIACFSGFLSGEGYGGPENSLTRWSDQGGPEILCDYGAAYSFMQYLYGHYGEAFLSQLHREAANGLDGLDAVLDSAGASESAMDVLHRWAATMALDNVVDQAGALTGGDAATYSEDTLGAEINWGAWTEDINHDGHSDDPGNEAYSTPGAPPNGSDYVRLGEGSTRTDRTYYSAGDLDSIEFDAAGSLPADDVEWTVDGTPPSGTSADLTCGPDGTPTGAPGTVADSAFYSGCGAGLDRSIGQQVQVPDDAATLTFRSLWDIEEGWDFGFVQVWDGESYTSIPCTDTTSEVNPDAQALAQDNLPGFTGTSDGWQAESCDLSDFAGRTVDLSFRYTTDGAANEAGWWVDDIAVGGTDVSKGSSLDGWMTQTQVHPTPVEGFTVQLVAYDDARSAAWRGDLPVTLGNDGRFHGSLSGTALHQAIGDSADTVAAIVMQDDRSEMSSTYARYALTANGVSQPGG